MTLPSASYFGLVGPRPRFLVGATMALGVGTMESSLSASSAALVSVVSSALTGDSSALTVDLGVLALVFLGVAVTGSVPLPAVLPFWGAALGVGVSLVEPEAPAKLVNFFLREEYWAVAVAAFLNLASSASFS